MDQTVVNGSIAAAVGNGTAGGIPGLESDTNWTTAVVAHVDLTPVLSPFESWQKVLIVLVIGICMVLTITGNILVLVSFIVDRTIRQPSNYFIASLAATDMLIGKAIVIMWDLKNPKTRRREHLPHPDSVTDAAAKNLQYTQSKSRRILQWFIQLNRIASKSHTDNSI